MGENCWRFAPEVMKVLEISQAIQFAPSQHQNEVFHLSLMCFKEFINHAKALKIVDGHSLSSFMKNAFKV
jgi:hypothetical protein